MGTDSGLDTQREGTILEWGIRDGNGREIDGVWRTVRKRVVVGGDRAGSNEIGVK